MINYQKLEGKEKNNFEISLHKNLLNAIRYNPGMPLHEFYENVCHDYKEDDSKKKQHSQTIRNRGSSHNQKSNKADPFQIYTKQQMKERKDEFKNMSHKMKMKAISHSWNLLSEKERKKVAQSSGHFT